MVLIAVLLYRLRRRPLVEAVAIVVLCGFLEYFSGARFANRKDGMDQLKLAFRHAGHASAELEWDGDPKGIRFRKPVEWLLGWGAMYDALAANALDDAIAGATEQPRPALAKLRTQPETPAPTEAPPADPMTAPTVAVSSNRWRSCRDDPPKGWTLAFLLTLWDGRYSYDVQLAQFHDGKWWGVYDESENDIEVDEDDWWTPAAVVPAEAWE